MGGVGPWLFACGVSNLTQNCRFTSMQSVSKFSRAFTSFRVLKSRSLRVNLESSKSKRVLPFFILEGSQCHFLATSDHKSATTLPVGTNELIPPWSGVCAHLSGRSATPLALILLVMHNSLTRTRDNGGNRAEFCGLGPTVH